MRFLHTADLHLGKRMNEFSLLEDQRQILRQIAAIAAEQRVDAVLIAGDVYQKASPPGEAMTLFNDFITGLTEQGVKVFIISGNHDDARRIAYFAQLLRQSGVYVSDRFDGRLQSVVLEDDHGPLVVSMLPFLRPSMVRPFFPEAEIRTTEEALSTVLASSPMILGGRHVLLAHQFVVGAETSESEELSVGGLDQVSAGLFNAFDYVALGHIHKPQAMGRKTLRYAGSPLAYSFSEAEQEKCVSIVDLGAMGEVAVETVPLCPLHRVREVRGSLSEVMALPYSEDYVRVTLTDEMVAPDARITVSTVFPNMMKFAVENKESRWEQDVTAGDSVENKTVQELFDDFYRLQNGGTPPSTEQMAVLTDVLQQLEEEQDETD